MTEGKLHRAFSVIKDTVSEWEDDHASVLAASLAYYTVFSIAPLVLLAVAIAGMIFGQEAARGEILQQLRSLFGEQGATVVESALKNSAEPSARNISSIIGIGVLVWSASGVFTALQQALDIIWDVKAVPTKNLRSFLFKRMLSFSAVLGTGFLLLVSLLLDAILSMISRYLSHLLPGNEVIWKVAHNGVSFLVTTVLFAFLFKYLPDARVRWKDVWIGALLTSVLFNLGRFVLGYYLGRGAFASVYGAAASLVILLAWVYYSSQILFLGAEFTQVYARNYGSKIEPEPHAVSTRDV